MGLFDIAEVARRSGIPASALRYYEERGLIESVGRHGLRRTFDAQVFKRLSLIALGRSAGFSLEEIGTMLEREGHIRLERAQLEAKAEEIDRKIRSLIARRDGLRHAVACPAPSHGQCSSFRRLMTIASKKMRKARART
ncbi:helix-turn-helix domain-containing protein [Novosphingobium sp.]|uniref:helix-turn-helix domain-containing protein n=1 Tax=Novosphingobium sp. TaxID=1874826 RepID=UPI0031D271DD